jgi:hypothetical protein
VWLGIAGVAVGALVSFALLERGEPEVTLPMLETKAVTATLSPAVVAEPAPAVAPPTLAARVEARPVVEAAPLGDKTPSSETRPIDVSPVREVGF